MDVSTMERVLDKIYKEVLYYEPDMVVMERKIEKIIHKLLAEEGDVDGKLGADKLKEIMFQVALEAESKAYWLGFRSCMKLLAKGESME